MNAMKYNGPEVNLGRFGPVKKGDVLLLTEREAECVHDDKRFQPVDAKVPKASATAVKRQEIAEMNREELVAYCEQIKAVDPTFSYKKDMDHQTLLAKVRQRIEQETKNPAGDNTE